MILETETQAIRYSAVSHSPIQNLIFHILRIGKWINSINKALQMTVNNHYKIRKSPKFTVLENEILEQLNPLASQVYLIIEKLTQRGIAYTFQSIEKWMIESGMTKTQFDEAMEDLLEAGYLKQL